MRARLTPPRVTGPSVVTLAGLACAWLTACNLVVGVRDVALSEAGGGQAMAASGGDASGGETSTGLGGGGGVSEGGAGGNGAGGDGGAGGNGGAGGVGGGSVDVSCYASHPCNPLVGEFCAEPGSACDLGTESELVCHPPPDNTSTLGQPCHGGQPACAHGLTCLYATAQQAGYCAELCCDDDACSIGRCQPHPTLPGTASFPLWVCQ